MKIYRSFIILVLVLFILGVVACNRPIPGSSKATSTIEGEGTVLPTGATDVMNQIYLFATQTAIATMGMPTGVLILSETPAAPVMTQPPIPTATLTPMPTSPSAAIVVPPPALVVPATYTLKKSEFPYCIARRFNVNPGELLRLNGLSSYSVFHAGMALSIPQTGHPFPGNRALRFHPTTYSVRGGETIYWIACYFGDVDPNAIAAVNGLTPPYRLTAGQVLNIP